MAGYIFQADDAGADTVGEAALQDGAVTTRALALEAVTADRIATGAVTTAKIGAGNVTAGSLATDAVETDKIKDGAVTADKLAPGAVEATSIGDGTVTRAKLEADIIDGTKLADNAVAAEHIAAGAVGSSELATGAAIANVGALGVESGNLAAGAVTAGKIAAGGVSATNQIADGIITAGKLAPGAVDAAATGTGAVTAPKFASPQLLTAGAATIDYTASREVALYPTADAQVFTLPTAAAGRRLTLINMHATRTIVMRVPGGDSWPNSGTTDLVLPPRCKVELFSDAQYAWKPLWAYGTPIPALCMINATTLSNAGDKLTTSAAYGDGFTPIVVEAQGYAASSAQCGITVGLYDGATATGTKLDFSQQWNDAASAGADFNLKGVIAATSSLKTLYLNLQSTAGTPNLQGGLRTTAIRAYWAPGVTV